MTEEKYTAHNFSYPSSSAAVVLGVHLPMLLRICTKAGNG